MKDSCILYGMPASLYTAKARSYLRKQHIAFEERPVGDPSFGPIVATIGRFIMPVIQWADGRVVQDGTAIIDDIEHSGLARLSAYPTTPVQRILSLIFELFGGEGLLRPAMHYRWNFDESNLGFLRQDFVAALAPNADVARGDAVFAQASGLMRQAASFFGVSVATIPAVEASYAEFLALFDRHLEHRPYLLGGQPTIGDYGLIGPLYAHLARDPAPARLMQQTARRVWRWTERMNAPEAQLDGLAGIKEALEADDAVPETLLALMRFISLDYLPELAAHVAFANDWLGQRPDLVSGTNGLDKPGARAIGMCGFEWRGHLIKTAVMPYRFWLLQRIQDAHNVLDVADQQRVQSILDAVGLAPLLTLRTARRVERINHLEVWGPSQN